MTGNLSLRRRAAPICAAALCLLVAVAPAPAPQDPVGRWKLTVEWTTGATEVTLAVSDDDGALSVRWEGPRGAIDGTDAAFDEGVLTFTLPVDDPSGREFELRYRGTLDGDELTGALRTPRDTEIPASGIRLRS